MRYLLLLLSVIVLSCDNEVNIKPSAMLRLDYPQAEYDSVKTDCPYSFQKNKLARIVKKRNCGVNIEYPSMHATLYLSYHDVRNDNLNSLLYDAQKLTYDHTIKAQSILEQPRLDSVKNVFGMLYMIDGNAATQSQFYVTDSVHHFVTGSVYFNVKPNFDSLYPAIEYLRNDVRVLMESIVWNEASED